MEEVSNKAAKANPFANAPHMVLTFILCSIGGSYFAQLFGSHSGGFVMLVGYVIGAFLSIFVARIKLSKV